MGVARDLDLNLERVAQWLSIWLLAARRSVMLPGEELSAQPRFPYSHLTSARFLHFRSLSNYSTGDKRVPVSIHVLFILKPGLGYWLA